MISTVQQPQLRREEGGREGRGEEGRGKEGKEKEGGEGGRERERRGGKEIPSRELVAG